MMINEVGWPLMALFMSRLVAANAFYEICFWSRSMLPQPKNINWELYYVPTTIRCHYYKAARAWWCLAHVLLAAASVHPTIDGSLRGRPRKRSYYPYDCWLERQPAWFD